jgi:hypothetical protein
MLKNTECDLRCHIPECNHDNGKCGGYVHIEYTGSRANLDSRVVAKFQEAARHMNSFIRPEAQMPYRTVNPKICNWQTNIPAGFKTNQLIMVVDAPKIDGVGGTLGSAGPCSQATRADGSRYTINGQMRFDVADVARMINEKRFINLVMHEMGHALGIGTLWPSYKLLQNARWSGNTENKKNMPKYSGSKANSAWKAYGGKGQLPIEETGGRGTADGHWKDSVLKDELMTGWLTRSGTPMSKVTLGSFEDMGIKVFMNKADAWSLSSRRLSIDDDVDVAAEEPETIGSDIIMPEYMEVYNYDGSMVLEPTGWNSTTSGDKEEHSTNLRGA